MKKWVLCFFLFMQNVQAEIEVYQFASPELELRYQTLTEELRCLVCQNQNIADSHAELAQDLRRKVYEMLNSGQTNTQIIDYMTARYGDFVLYRPPFSARTILLWFTPVLALLVGALSFMSILNRRETNADEQLSQNELARIKALLHLKSNKK